MEQITYLNEFGGFILRNAQRYAGTYFPLVNEGGMISSVTLCLGGDCKTGQNVIIIVIIFTSGRICYSSICICNSSNW